MILNRIDEIINEVDIFKIDLHALKIKLMDEPELIKSINIEALSDYISFMRRLLIPSQNNL